MNGTEIIPLRQHRHKCVFFFSMSRPFWSSIECGCPERLCSPFSTVPLSRWYGSTILVLSLSMELASPVIVVEQVYPRSRPRQEGRCLFYLD